MLRTGEWGHNRYGNNGHFDRVSSTYLMGQETLCCRFLNFKMNDKISRTMKFYFVCLRKWQHYLLYSFSIEALLVLAIICIVKDWLFIE